MAGGFRDIVFDRAASMREADFTAAGAEVRLGTAEFGGSGRGPAGFAGSAE
jgi:hypothetical protein